MTIHNSIERRWNGRTKNLKALGMTKWEANRGVLTAMINVLSDGRIRKLGQNQSSYIAKIEKAVFAEFGITKKVEVANLTDLPEATTKTWMAWPLESREVYNNVVAFAEEIIREIELN